MTTYRLTRKPLTAFAVRFNGHNYAEIMVFTGEGNFMQVEPRLVPGDGTIVAEVFNILSAEWVGVRVGQWIVRGLKAELYPIYDEVARAGYEEPEGGWPE
jgi:hypothetical protein